ncbi:MAG: ABC transporter ATP-binding protein [Actinomycetota bacterium]
MSEAAFLEVSDLVKEFPVRASRAVVRAVADVSFTLGRGRSLGIVGESGSGKSTLVRCVLRLLEPDSGRVVLDGVDLTRASRGDLRRQRRKMQIVFQDPFSALDPRMTVGAIVAEPLLIHRVPGDRAARVAELLRLVGLDADHVNRYPHEFSGGQRQRVGIARALALAPELLVLDEPVSALDVSIRAGIVGLLEELRQRLGLSYLLVAHDPSFVRQITDEVAVMHLGRIVEHGPTETVLDDPRHPYTRALMSAVPVPDPVIERTRARIVLRGEMPSSIAPPSGCSFRTRCPEAEAACAVDEPMLEEHEPGHRAACPVVGRVGRPD